MKLKYIGDESGGLVHGKIYECAIVPEDHYINLICREGITFIGRVYIGIEEFLKYWEEVSNV